MFESKICTIFKTVDTCYYTDIDTAYKTHKYKIQVRLPI